MGKKEKYDFRGLNSIISQKCFTIVPIFQKIYSKNVLATKRLHSISIGERRSTETNRGDSQWKACENHHFQGRRESVGWKSWSRQGGSEGGNGKVAGNTSSNDKLSINQHVPHKNLAGFSRFLVEFSSSFFRVVARPRVIQPTLMTVD